LSAGLGYAGVGAALVLALAAVAISLTQDLVASCGVPRDDTQVREGRDCASPAEWRSGRWMSDTAGNRAGRPDRWRRRRQSDLLEAVDGAG
jgi:hypothetical protein